MKKLAFLFLLLTPGPGWAAEAWNCQLSGHAGIWQVDGEDLVGPASRGSLRLPIVRNTPDALVALSEELSGRRFELIVIDRSRLTIRIFALPVAGDAEQRETGLCSLPDARAATAARAETGDVRRRVRDLVQQAQSLANRGFTSAASLKLIEAQGFERLTPDENRLIAQAKQYVASKPRR